MAKKSEYAKALAAYSEALKIFHSGNFDTAAELLSKFPETYPNEKELIDRVNIYLKICREHSGPPSAALKTFEDLYQHGMDMMFQGKYSDALDALNKAHTKDPKNGKILYMLADVSYLNGDSKSCLDYLEKAVDLNPHIAIMAQNEVDFDSLKEDPRFGKIVDQA